MREPVLASRLVEAVLRASPVPVTVKMRLGWDEGSRNAAELAKWFAGAGVCGFTVHGRTRQQFYTGTADWAAIRAVCDEVGSVPVVANGDVVDLRTARACLDASGARSVMIGRGAVGQPWLVGEIARGLADRPQIHLTGSAKADTACEHYEGLLDLYGERIGTRHARKHLAAYADRAREAGFGLDPAARAELVTATEPARVLRLLSGIYAEARRDPISHSGRLAA